MAHNTLNLPRGPVMVDIAGFALTEQERARLSHPLVGGIILFRRNFQNVEQLRALTAEIRALRSPHLLIAVDHEGGRVQRFLDGFTRLPPMNVLGELWDQNQDEARKLAETVGYVLAAELSACGIDLSFTPVLDLDWERCAVIGNRSFHRDPEAVAELAEALQQGLGRGGMMSCGKHYPGHGYVEGDSHHLMPQDDRALADIERDDLVPFARLAEAGMGAVMPAHVLYPAVDSQPAGFSKVWLTDILRGQLGFDGVIFSDALDMAGAAGAGTYVQRADAALAAGCDMVLVCNQPEEADIMLAGLVPPLQPKLAERLERMAGKSRAEDWQQQIATPDFAAAQAVVKQLAMPKDALTGPQVGEAH
ncbi:beta-N-acetylhexosaminidase [Chromobacterium sp. IIBBL 290-4]|uniref:beta-N-acetylhexosaminidase n=1 Tax=Chromobacterium sp. IIBBL 290-4 TaxID=2953890 RepID=UPI0020B7E42F|nr:beta-N-acetylhexosaminidase [Chromobacterium sp. IIBBL 290-4]UTH73697.1 beta-N-acetylhexosaminidase [Chromobacterium sp. IIBBL 290-4]